LFLFPGAELRWRDGVSVSWESVSISVDCEEQRGLSPVLSNMTSLSLRRALRLILACGLILPARAAYADAATAPKVIVSEARVEHFVDRLEALGTLRAIESVTLTVSVTETISAIHFDDGDRVEKDQILVEMTSAEEHAQLEEARALKEEGYRQFRRVQSLEAQGTAAKSLLDERRREWETARARLAAIESRLADRLIRAPFAGVVGLRDLSVGALVEPGDAVTTLDDDALMKLDFEVPSTYLQTLRPGLAISATAHAFPGRVFAGEVKAVGSRVDPATRSIRVRAVLPNPERILKPGLLMQVELLKNPRDALVIPEEALVPLGDRQSVLLVDTANGNTVVRRAIRIGARRPGEVEVLDGLAAGERVISHGTLKVRPGQQVSIAAVDDGSTPYDQLLQSLGDSDAP
jgi:membrane fusion protein (multidrug efflux system)